MVKNIDRVSEKIANVNVKKEKGYLYFVDKDGDLARVPAKWNEDPEFVGKEELKTCLNEKEISFSKENYSLPYDEIDTSFVEPIPVTDENIPTFFKNKKILYSDLEVIETICDNALTTGHIKIYSRSLGGFEKIPEENFIHNATVASINASVLFEGLKAQGTNIIFNEINGISQISVLPRFENDGIQLNWDLKQGDFAKIKIISEKIKKAFFMGDLVDTTKINLDAKPKKVNIVDKSVTESKVNYMLEHLKRDC